MANAAAEEKKRKTREVDFKKLGKVIATIIGISMFAILFTILASKLMQHLTKSKKKKAGLAKGGKMSMSVGGGGAGGGGMMRVRSSSSASSSTTQVTLNAQVKQQQQQLLKKNIVMPPSVMPALNNVVTPKSKLSDLRKNFKYKNEDESLHLMNENLNDSNSNHHVSTNNHEKI